MKRQTVFLIFAIIFSSAVTAFIVPASAEILSLDEAIAIAFKHNLEIQITEQEVIAAQADIQGAQSAFLPKLNANAGFTRNASVLSIPVPAATKKDLGVYTGYRSDNKLGLSLNQTINNGGANTANLHQKQIALDIQKQTLRARKLDLEFEVKRLYYGLLLARETERIAQNLLDQALSHYAEVKQKYDQGTVSRFDLLQSSVQVSKLKPELIKAQNASDLIEAELKKILGYKLHLTLALKDNFQYTPIELKETEFLQTAYLDKPEMTLLALGVDINKWSIELARSGHKPQINAQLDYNYRSNDVTDMINTRHNSWDAGVSVSIPIFDGFSTKAKVDAAQARYSQAKLEKENLAEQISVDIRKAVLDLRKAQAVIDSQKDTIVEAQEALRISGVRYANAEGTNQEVLDAQVSLSQVEKNLSEGIYDYIIAQAFLDRTMGQSHIKGDTK